jgi:hypothetical protein
MLLGVFNHRNGSHTSTLYIEVTSNLYLRFMRDKAGFGGRRALSSAGKVSADEVLGLRATSTVSRDRSVKRSAQDDDFVGILRKTA